jgi:hypothetical protein
MIEAERNRVLRRADWRFLLPDPAPARVLCLAGAELRAACAAIAAVVDEAPSTGTAYDLVVAENPDAESLHRMAASLAPGGACYTEWTGLAAARASSVRAMLEGVGLRAARTVQPWPTIAPARAWLPTEGAAARRYWRSAVRGTRVRRDQLRAAAGALRARAGLHGRISALAFGPAADPRPALLQLAADAGHVAPSDDLVLVTLGPRAVGKVVALVPDADGVPALAIKTARAPEGAAGVAREAEVLEAVARVHGGGVSGVPRVLFHAELAGTPVVGETALTGVPLAATLDARRYPAMAERVTAWLGALAAPVRESREPAWSRVIAPAFQRFLAEFGGVVDAREMRVAERALRALPELQMVCEQRDFSPWNVFQGREGLVVLDWESGQPEGVPALDLIYFATHAAFYLEGAWVSNAYVAAYRAAWSRESAIGRVNLACVARYLDALGLDARIAPALRLLAWAIHAHSDYVHRQLDVGGATPSADQLRGSRFLALFDAELAEIERC